MTFIRKTIELVDSKVDDIPTDGSVSNTKVFARAFAWGSLEGFVDALVTIGAVVSLGVIVQVVNNFTSKNK